MDFVDEQHVALFEIGEQRREIARLGDHRAGGRAKIHAEFARDDLRERRLAETRRTDEQHMVERFAARPRRLDEDLEIGARLRLADEIGERLRAQRRFGRIFVAAFGGDEAARLISPSSLQPEPDQLGDVSPRQSRPALAGRARRRRWRRRGACGSP